MSDLLKFQFPFYLKLFLASIVQTSILLLNVCLKKTFRKMLQLRIDSGKVSWPPLSQPPFYLWICLNSDVPTTILPLNLPGLQCSNLHLTFKFPWPPMFQPPFDLQVVLPPMSQPPLYLHIVLASSLPCPSLRPNSCWDIPSGPSPSTNL